MSYELLHIKLKIISVLLWIVNSVIHSKMIILPFKNKINEHMLRGKIVFSHITQYNYAMSLKKLITTQLMSKGYF